MKLSIDNFGKIKSADIDVKALTVIAGANSSGKSTVGKLFYALLNAFAELEKYNDAQKQTDIVRKHLTASFANRFKETNDAEQSNLLLTVRDKSAKVTISSNKELTIEYDPGFSYAIEAFYIDPSSIRDAKKLAGAMHQQKADILVDRVTNLIEEHLQDCNYEPGCISSGLKTFMRIRTLLQKGHLHENSLLILDEPEIHLHPEWQLELAELLTMISNSLGSKILLDTHSPYFMEAIEVFSIRHRIDGCCNYYLSELVGNRQSVITDASSDIDRIYHQMAAPFEKLEKIRNDLDNE